MLETFPPELAKAWRMLANRAVVLAHLSPVGLRSAPPSCHPSPSSREVAVGVTAPRRACGVFGGPEVYTEMETVTLLMSWGNGR